MKHVLLSLWAAGCASNYCKQHNFFKQTLGLEYCCLGCWLLFLCCIPAFNEIHFLSNLVIEFPVFTKIIQYLLVSAGGSIQVINLSTTSLQNTVTSKTLAFKTSLKKIYN